MSTHMEIADIIRNCGEQREAWIKAVLTRQGLGLFRLSDMREYFLASHTQLADCGGYQAVLWHKGEPIAAYMESIADGALSFYAYEVIPETMPDGFNMGLLDAAKVFAPVIEVAEK